MNKKNYRYSWFELDDPSLPVDIAFEIIEPKKYAGLQYVYGKVETKEDEDQLRLAFTVYFLDKETHDLYSEKIPDDLQNVLGNILKEQIENRKQKWST